MVNTMNAKGLAMQKTGGQSQYKDVFLPVYGYHVKEKDGLATVLSLTWESPYLGKTVLILKRIPVRLQLLYWYSFHWMIRFQYRKMKYVGGDI